MNKHENKFVEEHIKNLLELHRQGAEQTMDIARAHTHYIHSPSMYAADKVHQFFGMPAGWMDKLDPAEGSDDGGDTTPDSGATE